MRFLKQTTMLVNNKELKTKNNYESLQYEISKRFTMCQCSLNEDLIYDGSGWVSHFMELF